MDLKNKYDRLIVLISFGILIISCVFTMSIVFYQDVEKENRKMEQRQIDIAETIHIKIWRTYHQEQMVVLNDIKNLLEKIESQNTKSSVQPASVKGL